MKKMLFLIVCALYATAGSAQSNYRALRFSQPEAFFATGMLTVHQQNLERRQAFEAACQSRKGMERYIREARARFRRIAGPLPERGDLKARTVATDRGNGFDVEKIIFQSTPGRYVTAHLYLPAGRKGKVPACIEMCGHALTGKGNGSMTAERMAVNGIAVLVTDPIGQGERLQLIDAEGKPLTRGVTTSHTLLNPAFCLLGSSLAAQEYFDNSRAVDYLQSRSDIDGDRIGSYGFSGGGTQSAYLIGLDDRIKVGCIGLFFSSRERTLETQGPSDGCQWIPYEGRERIEIADMAMMMAPRPFIVLDGKYDFVDHWGALQGFEELRRCYATLGHPERVDQYYCEDGHAAPPDVQTKMVKWFRKWLIGDESELRSLDYWRGTDMNCTSKGQVNLEFADAKTTMQLCLEEMDRLADERSRFCRQPLSHIRDTMKALLGLPLSFNDSIEAVPTGHSSLRDAEEFRYQLNCTGQFPVPVIVRVPSDVSPHAKIIIHLHDAGKGWYLEEKDRRDATSDGTIELAADLCGFGETADPSMYNLSKYWNKEFRSAVTALHAGRPLMGRRVADIRTLLNFCSRDSRLRGRLIEIVADGINAVAVMHATVLDDRISRAQVTDTLRSWRSYIEQPLQRDMMSNTLIGVLRRYDIPDLVRLSKGRIVMAD
ncbi:MAG: acetylxylan esterase [Prevotella sp.]|nr:acetylxylan esterase [Prevotella sp.]